MQRRENRRGRYKKSDFFSETSALGVKVPDASDYALEGALKTLKRNLKDEGRLQRFKDNKEYTKPTTKRRKLKNDAIRRQAMEHSKEVAFWDNFTWTIMTKDGPL
jgi:ribosomal protein S21